MAKSEHQHIFNRWLVTTREWRCGCGAVQPPAVSALRSPEPMGDPQAVSPPEALLQQIDAAHKELCAAVDRQWTGGHALKMSIPARPDHDTDLIIGAALRAAREALSAASPPSGSAEPQDKLTTTRDGLLADVRQVSAQYTARRGFAGYDAVDDDLSWLVRRIESAFLTLGAGRTATKETP